MVADLSGSLGVQPYQAVLGQLQEFEQERAKAILEQARAHFAAKAPQTTGLSPTSWDSSSTRSTNSRRAPT